MYLEHLYCENMGPISKIAIKLGFSDNGDPKPLILVGKNGAGKSILISTIVDSLFEFGSQAYDDITEKIEEGRAYFKITSTSQIKCGEKAMIFHLRHKMKKSNNPLEYLYQYGHSDSTYLNNELTLAGLSPSFINKWDRPKVVTQNKNDIEDDVGGCICCYFPPERSWIRK